MPSACWRPSARRCSVCLTLPPGGAALGLPGHGPAGRSARQCLVDSRSVCFSRVRPRRAAPCRLTFSLIFTRYILQICFSCCPLLWLTGAIRGIPKRSVFCGAGDVKSSF